MKSPGRVRREVQVGCGSCLGCRSEQARQWSVRLMHERQLHDAAWFLTLTYSDEELPTNGSLDPQHLQGFFKSLRRDHPPRSVRYFACGEYGETSQRPHYHAVLFGPDFLDRVEHRFRDGSLTWRSSSLESHWPYGFSEIGTVTRASCAYVAGYVRKKVSRSRDPDHYLRYDPETGELVELVQEFTRMSLRPAIGKEWFRRFWRDVYPRDSVVVEGKEYKPPRYYDKLMDGDCGEAEGCFASSCEEHKEMMLGVRERRLAEAIDKTSYQLQAGEKIHEARTKLFARRDKV